MTRQNYTVSPRHWYVDATLRCNSCGGEYLFSANEQKAWYEDFGFYVDSFPDQCKTCRRDQRNLKALDRNTIERSPPPWRLTTAK